MENAISITLDSPGLSDVPGFTCAGVSADVRGKGDDRRDTVLVYSESCCTAAGMFTTNDVKAAPVVFDQKVLAKGGPFHGFVANSGNANACTGKQGMVDTQAMAAAAEKACGAPEGSFFVCSTGRIGRALPMDKLLPAIAEAGKALGNSAAQSQDAAWAILTSDTRPKTVTATFEACGKTVTIAGMAKGAGMIEPNMATMLAFIATDAKISALNLQTSLRRANAPTFNAITVDGDMSTNDTVLVLANGQSDCDLDESPECKALFEKALQAVCRVLALKIAGDGERITKLIQLVVEGAPDNDAALKVARSMGNSLLVKTSWYGSDPNWGRLLDAAGYARIGLVEEKLDLSYFAGHPEKLDGTQAVPVLRKGEALHDKVSDWKAVVIQKEFTIHLNLHLGKGAATLFATDLSEGYVDFNKSE